MIIRNEDFFTRDAYTVAQDLVGKILHFNGKSLRITETECYIGEEDLACHASKGRTKRTEMLYKKGGVCYVYLCYGIHSLINVITGKEDEPQGVLIRACEGYEGPGKLTKYLGITCNDNGESFITSDRIYIEDDGVRFDIEYKKRVGIDYAGEYWANKLWRFVAKR